MSKKDHPWNKGRPKVVGRNLTKPRGDIEAVYTHRIEPHEPVVQPCDDQNSAALENKEDDQ